MVQDLDVPVLSGTVGSYTPHNGVVLQRHNDNTVLHVFRKKCQQAQRRAAAGGSRHKSHGVI